MTRCKDLFAEAAALPPDARSELLGRVCADDAELRLEVERLLAAFDGAGDFLESSAVERSAFTRRFDDPGTRIGNYIVREQLGEGGMGVVWKAEQTTPVRRQVALKLLRPGTESRHLLARFETERQSLERVEHPNIARMLDAGSTDSGRPYFVMELVRGAPITTFCDARRLSVLERLALFVPVCRAVQHAHAKGVIHRDLKPSNILIADDGPVATPKVIDFSIARAVDRSPEETHYTQNLLLLGTPAYVSPEQAVGSPDVDTRTDVYSLGAVLYQLLCGTPPVDAASLSALATDEFLRRLQEVDPVRPSRRLATRDDLAAIADARQSTPAALRRTLSGDLDRIVMKALDKDPARRYETAAAFADDLERYGRHEPVTAVRPSAGYHALKFARRHRAGVIAAVLVLASVLGGATVSTWLAIRAAASEARYRREAYISDLNLADDALRSDDPRRMKELLDRHIPEEGETDPRGFSWNYLYRHCTAPGQLIDRSEHPLYFVRLAPGDRLLAATGADGIIRFYDTNTWKRTRSFHAGQKEVNGLDFSPDGALLASAGDDGSVKLWNVATGTLTKTIRVFDGPAFHAAFIRDNGDLLLAVCGRDPTIRLIDAVTGELRGELQNQQRAIEAIAASTGQRLAAASEDGVPRVWNVATNELLMSWPDMDFDGLTSVAFSPDGRYIAFGTLGQSFVICDSQSSLPPVAWPINSERPGEGEGAQSLAFGPGGEYLLTADRGGNMRICRFDAAGQPVVDLADGRYPRWAAHPERIYAVAVTADGRQIISAGADGALWVWRPFEGSDGWNVSSGEIPYVVDIAVGPAGKVVLAGDDMIGLYDVRQGLVKMIARSNGHRYHTVAISSDGSVIAGGTQEGRIILWTHDQNGGLPRWKQDNARDWDVVDLALSPDGRYLAAVLNPRSDDSRELRLFDATSGRVLAAMPVASSSAVIFRPDSRMLSIDRDNDVLLCEVPSLKILGILKEHSQSVEALAFSPDGRQIASGGLDRYVVVWDVETMAPKQRFLASGGAIRSIAFAPHGGAILSTGDDLVPRITDLATARQMMRFPRLTADHWPMQYLRDEMLVVARHPTRGLYVFDGRPIEANRLGPNLPADPARTAPGP